MYIILVLLNTVKSRFTGFNDYCQNLIDNIEKYRQIVRGPWVISPFGGVSIAWSRDLNHVITPLTDYNHKRVVAVELTTTKENIIFISVYMPFLDSRNRESCRANAMETISMIETIIHDHPRHLIVIGGILSSILSFTWIHLSS